MSLKLLFWLYYEDIDTKIVMNLNESNVLHDMVVVMRIQSTTKYLRWYPSGYCRQMLNLRPVAGVTIFPI